MEEKDLEGVVINEFESDSEMSKKLTPESIEPHQLFLTKSANNAATSIGLPIGSIFPSVVPIVDARVHILDGSVISQTGVYQDFATLIKTLVDAGHPIACTEAEYNITLNNTGNCGKFVINNSNQTIRLPRITTFVEGLYNISDIGKAMAAGIPNITGKWTSGWNVTSRGFHALTVSGAYYDSYAAGLHDGDGRIQGVDSNNTSTRGYPWFDASRGETKTDGTIRNDVYGKSNTVQPSAVRYPYYIVLANGYKSSKVVNTDYILNELNVVMHELSTYKATLATKITFNDLYPVGSIFLTLNDKGSPAAIYGGTWERLPSGYALWTASSGAGNTIKAGLPNITGYLHGTMQYYGNKYGSSGAFRWENGNDTTDYDGDTATTGRYKFDANQGAKHWNSAAEGIYGNSTTVQPPAFKVYAYRRIL